MVLEAIKKATSSDSEAIDQSQVDIVNRAASVCANHQYMYRASLTLLHDVAHN